MKYHRVNRAISLDKGLYPSHGPEGSDIIAIAGGVFIARTKVLLVLPLSPYEPAPVYSTTIGNDTFYSKSLLKITKLAESRATKQKAGEGEER